MQFLRKPAFPHRLLVSFDQEFGPFEREIGQLCQEIQVEASLASKQAQKQENELQARERSRAGKSRRLIAHISDNLDKSNMEDKMLRLKIDRRNLRKKKLQALDNLSTYDYQKTYKQTRKECILGTSDWILEESKFKTWKEGNSKGLWCSGKSAKMMESTSPKDVTSFFFCRFDDQESLKARTIVGSIARQFVSDIPEDNFHGFCNETPVIKYLEIALSHTRQYSIILDGLDECSEVEIREVSGILHRLLSFPHLQIKIFWFSRPNIVDWLPPKLKTEQQISLETSESQDRIASDIRKFIQITLEEWLEGDTPKLRILDPTTVLMAVEYLENEAYGIVQQYLLSRPANKSLSRYHIDIEEADAYAGAICVTYLNLSVSNKQLIRTPKANISAGAITSTVIKNSLPVGNSTNKIALRILRHRDQSNKSVQRLLEEAAGDNELTRRSAVLGQYSFHPYAQRFWLDHTKKGIAPDSGKLWRLWSNLLDDAHWRDTLSSQPWTFEDWKEGSTNIVQWIVENNHCTLARLLVERELAEENLQTLIEGAAARGFTELTKIGLSSRIIPYTVLDSSGLTWAAKGGYLAVVETLLKENADVDTWTALEAAAGEGHLAVVERLLQEKADVDTQTVLEAAAGGGHLAVVERLLQEKADVDTQTALEAAAGGGHLAVVERLLQEKARVNAAAGYNGRTPLQAAAEGGHLAVVERLLQEKADVNAAAASYDGRTALQAAAGGGLLAVIERLLQEKADVNAAATDIGGRTALQAAAGRGRLAVVERLLQEKADVNAAAASYDGRTALHAAVVGGHLAVVERLRALGAK
ncbi:MAG: hypothetical protein Q9171_002844 [Xanthocarpia ochracea]